MKEDIIPIKDEIVLYQSEDGNVKVDVLFQDETVWLTQEQMAMLFGKGRTTITEHIANIFSEGELNEEVVCRKFRHTTSANNRMYSIIVKNMGVQTLTNVLKT